jgi:hypothetical protein
LESEALLEFSDNGAFVAFANANDAADGNTIRRVRFVRLVSTESSWAVFPALLLTLPTDFPDETSE